MMVKKTSGYQKTFTEQCLPVITWNKKCSWTQAATITFILEKKFFAFATFEGLGVLSFQTE